MTDTVHYFDLILPFLTGDTLFVTLNVQWFPARLQLVVQKNATALGRLTEMGFDESLARIALQAGYLLVLPVNV